MPCQTLVATPDPEPAHRQPRRSLGLVLIEEGICPACGAFTETADGLAHSYCARSHPAVRYELYDTRAMDARQAWD